jgi:hypothetical protein
LLVCLVVHGIAVDVDHPRREKLVTVQDTLLIRRGRTRQSMLPKVTGEFQQCFIILGPIQTYVLAHRL